MASNCYMYNIWKKSKQSLKIKKTLNVGFFFSVDVPEETTKQLKTTSKPKRNMDANIRKNTTFFIFGVYAGFSTIFFIIYILHSLPQKHQIIGNAV